MSWSLQKKKRGHFLHCWFCPNEIFLTYGFSVMFCVMYSVLNTLAGYTYFYRSKTIASYTFLLVFKLIGILQCILKGTLMQTWKYPNMFLFLQKYYPENFSFLILRILKLFTRKVCEMFVYKQTETIEYVKK